MAFFRISDYDESALETEILREIKTRDLPHTGDTELLGEFNRRHSSVCRLLRQTDQERARLDLHIAGLNEAVAIKDRHIDAQDKHLNTQDKHLNEQDKHLNEQDKHIERQNKHITAQAEEIDALKRSHDGLANLVKTYKQHIETIHHSLSWRIMKPIRLMKQRLTKRSS